MKKTTSLFLIMLCLSSLAQTATDSVATIVFYRTPAYSASANSFKLTDTLGTVIRLYNQSYYVYHCKPGDYRFTIAGQKWNKLKVSAKAGRTYYYKASVYAGFWSMQYEIEEADSVVANRSLAKHVHMDMNKPLVRPRNRIGITVGAGFGFDEKAVLSTIEGDDINMSFGGGFGIGGYIGRELTKHLDLEIGYRHFSGGLVPDIDEGSMEFKRHIISVTPSFIIPVDGGYTRRIKLGLGADIYLGNTLEINLAKIPKGINDTWKYSDAYGYHIKAVYEVNPGTRWSFLWGFRYNAVRHSFASGDRYFPTDDFFIKPDGSGLDLIFGAGFHF